MYFEYDNEFLVKRIIDDGNSDQLSGIIEMLEDDIYDVLHTSPEELDDERFRLMGETEDEEEAIEEGTLLAGHEEAMKLYRYLVDLHKRAEQALVEREASEEYDRQIRAEQALVEREASEEYDRQIRAEQVNDYSDRCCPQPIYYI